MEMTIPDVERFEVEDIKGYGRRFTVVVLQPGGSRTPARTSYATLEGYRLKSLGDDLFEVISLGITVRKVES